MIRLRIHFCQPLFPVVDNREGVIKFKHPTEICDLFPFIHTLGKELNGPILIGQLLDILKSAFTQFLEMRDRNLQDLFLGIFQMSLRIDLDKPVIWSGHVVLFEK